MRSVVTFLGLLLTMLLPFEASAQDRDRADWDKSVFFFGGVFTAKGAEFLLHPWATEFEDNFIGGAGVSYHPFQPILGGLRAGLEAGVAIRGGLNAVPSLEGWLGVNLRYDGIVLGPVRVSPSMTAGFSAVTGTMGVEAQRERDAVGGGDAHLLFYLGPELNLSLVDAPDYEAFVRLQHRSGGNTTLGNMYDGANALVGGVRYHF